MTTREDTPAPRPSPDLWRVVTSIGSPIALASALLLYFGWARSDAQARAFGADVSVFGMSPQDLVLRSVDALFFPLILLLLGWLLVLRLRPLLERRASVVAPVLRWAWLLVVPGLVLTVVTPGVGRVLLPGWVLLAVGGTAYGGHLRRRRRDPGARAPLAVTALVTALLLVALFWQVESLASVWGRAQAAAIKDAPATRLAPVSVVSGSRLHVDGPGVTETTLPGEEGALRWCYSGLYLLQHSGGKHFLLTDGWDEGRGRLLPVADTESVRLQFGGSPGCPRQSGGEDIRR